jgi:ATP-dependent DNA helicase RecG
VDAQHERAQTGGQLRARVGQHTNREYRQLCPDVSPETLRLDLADLVDRGVLLKIGSKKGTYYILK